MSVQNHFLSIDNFLETLKNLDKCFLNSEEHLNNISDILYDIRNNLEDAIKVQKEIRNACKAFRQNSRKKVL